MEVDDLIRIRRETLVALKALEGKFWREVGGELHYQYKEMPNWFELDEGMDVEAAHRAFVDVFAPYFVRLNEVNVTVSYNLGEKQLVFLDTNEDVRFALDDPAFGMDWR